MEIIASKKGGLLGLYFFSLVVSFVMLVAGIVVPVFISEALIFALFAVAGVVLVCVSGYIIYGIINTPQIIVAYENGKLRCGNLEFLPSQIKNVEYRPAHARGISYRWGKLKIFLDGRTLSFNYVADVEMAHNRLIQLMLEK